MYISITVLFLESIPKVRFEGPTDILAAAARLGYQDIIHSQRYNFLVHMQSIFLVDAILHLRFDIVLKLLPIRFPVQRRNRIARQNFQNNLITLLLQR